MRTLLASLLVAGLAAAAPADDEKKPPAKKAPEKKEPTLKVGDKAPPLKATKWMQGGEVAELAPGKVYVVEFWATWCGPCIVMMPHLGDLQKEYRDKGVTVIGYTAKDPNNTEEKVAAFVKKRGPKLGYTFAYADDKDTYDAWMKAAGRNGIPCAFVIDTAGKIAYIGHPMYLDVVLPKVAAGSWAAADADKLKEVEEAVNEVFKSLRSPDGLKTLTEFEAKYPALANIPYFVGPKLTLLLKAEKYDEATKLAEKVIAKAEDQDDPTALRSVAGALKEAPREKKKEFAALGLKAAEAGVKVAGDKDAMALLTLADAHATAGDPAKAKEAAKKALAAVEGESAGMKRYVEQQAKKYDDEKKDDK